MSPLNTIKANLLILPGNSIRQREHAERLAEAFKFDFGKVVVASYGHWQSGAPSIDFMAERAKLSALVAGLEPYVVLAKSAGSILALLGIRAGILKPERCVFLGMPLKWSAARDFEIHELFEGYTVPTLLIQQENDPFANTADMQAMLDHLKLDCLSLKVIPGDDHSYNDMAELRTLAFS